MSHIHTITVHSLRNTQSTIVLPFLHIPHLNLFIHYILMLIILQRSKNCHKSASLKHHAHEAVVPGSSYCYQIPLHLMAVMEQHCRFIHVSLSRAQYTVIGGGGVSGALVQCQVVEEKGMQKLLLIRNPKPDLYLMFIIMDSQLSSHLHLFEH